MQRRRLLAAVEHCADIAGQFVSGSKASETIAICLFAHVSCYIFKGIWFSFLILLDSFFFFFFQGGKIVLGVVVHLRKGR